MIAHTVVERLQAKEHNVRYSAIFGYSNGAVTVAACRLCTNNKFLYPEKGAHLWASRQASYVIKQ